MKGYLLRLDEISAFNFDAPWWSRHAIDSLRLNDRIYMAFGDVNYYFFDFQSIIICNTPFVTDCNMPDPYTLVKEEGPAHRKEFTMSCSVDRYCEVASGHSKKQAEQECAAQMIRTLQSIRKS